MYVSDLGMKQIEESQQFATPHRQEQTFVQQKQIFSPQTTATIEPSDKIIGQYHDTYILIDTEEGLEIVDQHIAQERYIYEKLKSEKILFLKCFLYQMLSPFLQQKLNLLKKILKNLKNLDMELSFLTILN